VSELDPYALLGVPRTATRLEIARAYRRLAKRWHPDATGPPSEAQARAMARINHAWNTLQDPSRRASWDAAHPTHPPRAIDTGTPRAPAATREWQRRLDEVRPRTRPDSGLFAVAVIAVAATFLAGAMIVLAAPWATQPELPFGPNTAAFETAELSFHHPPNWSVALGEDDPDAAHRVVVHLVNAVIEDATFCTTFDAYCALADEDLPLGGASVIVTEWSTGTPPEPDPIQRLPAGLSGRHIGGAPAAFRLSRGTEQSVAWWQLSPPGVPDRWFEVRADIAGQRVQQEELLAEIDAILATAQFGPLTTN
jgi:hypothetical protein